MSRINLLNLISISAEYNETKEIITQAIKLGKILVENSRTEEEREQIQKSVYNLQTNQIRNQTKISTIKTKHRRGKVNKMSTTEIRYLFSSKLKINYTTTPATKHTIQK